MNDSIHVSDPATKEVRLDAA